jgi:uncharacterized protein (DUF58 family)
MLKRFRERTSAAWRARMRAWSLRRHGPDRLPLDIVRRRVYILPTSFGFSYGAIVFGMLLAGLNYNNNLALALTFVLAAVAVVAMHYCHRNLAGVQLRALEAEPVFVGQSAMLRVELLSASALDRLDLEIRADDSESVCVSVPARERLACEVPVRAHRRGRNRVARLALETRFPLRLFRAWAWVYDCAEFIAYPRPDGSAPPPLAATSASGRHDAPGRGEEDFAGLRDYRKGDSPRRVSWKAFARTDQLLAKEYSGAARRWLVLDLNHTPGADLEARLSQLARWVVDAEGAAAAYALDLPGTHLALGTGAAHERRCLLALALHGEPSATVRL